MAAKRKKKEVVSLETIILEDQEIIDLKKKYFKLIVKENIPNTPTLTKQLDEIELKIKNRTTELSENFNS